MPISLPGRVLLHSNVVGRIAHKADPIRSTKYEVRNAIIQSECFISRQFGHVDSVSQRPARSTGLHSVLEMARTRNVIRAYKM